MGVLSDGNPYGIPEGIIFSFPCSVANGVITIVNTHTHVRLLV